MSSQQRNRRDNGQVVLKGRLEPHWFSNNDRFWYRNDLAQGVREFIVVDAVAGTRAPAFDANLVAARLSEKLGKDVDALRLPIDGLDFAEDGKSVTLSGAEGKWIWNFDSKQLTKQILAPEKENEAAGDGTGLKPETELRGSNRTGPDTEITFDNQTNDPVAVFWIDPENRPQPYGQVEPKSRRGQHTFGGHRWLVENLQGDRLAVFEATDDPNVAVIDGVKRDVRSDRGRRRQRGAPPSERSDRSPDNKWRAFIQDNNVYVRQIDGDRDEGDAIALSTDGGGDFEYSPPVWSPDSKSLVAFRIETAETEQVHLLQSSPDGGGRAVLKSRPYALPGDRFAKHELNVFQVESRKQIKPSVDRFEHGWERPRVRWNLTNGSFTYKIVDRGHQRQRIVSVDPQTGEVINLVDEKSQTFIWTIHTEDLDLQLINWMEKSDEVIYVSEQSGWRHLYLVSADRPGMLQPITTGEWVVRGIQQIDEERRQVWFSASGCYPGQDPYLVHFGRVNFDGTGLVWLTADDGDHSLEYSPDRRFVIDRYSRVDLPPKHGLRRVDNGQLVCHLEEADTSSLAASGWKTPEVFMSLGRDGKTEIWGIICRPANYDPQKKYPVIEDIYAGPQGAFVPKNFSTAQRYKALNELGFIVVKIDGMGTANRSKAFHDVCWHNLKDGGFEDRILWMKAAGAKYPELDLERVGIYGVSAGGQNAAAAVLFHPEFYKVAVAGCGCHDNRMDKASWNEQWMGYPVGPHYAECSNIDNAHRLRGNLLLIVGEMDDNVPPESTLRFADALIRADKDFDLLVVPNAGHGIGGAYGERRMRDFFVRHLQGKDVPNRN
ncbi:MAG: prolyl oligopeptidase family serine peptidase [Pirellulaceae bacterium]|nr:prolyl oligopeptidase family serine peptidase [Pirellulaceae bacterium]